MITLEKRKLTLEKMKDAIEEKIVGADLDIRHLNRLLIIKNAQADVANQLSQVKRQKEAWEGVLLTIEDELKDNQQGGV